MRIYRDICYGSDARTQSVNLYLPDGEKFVTFVYFHGGGLENGSRRDAERIAETMTDRGIGVVSAEYRMYPEAKYPEFIEDAAAAVAWTVAHIAEYGISEGIYVGGSSAGGYLSMMLCFDARYLAAHGLAPEAVDGYVHDAGQPTCHYNVLRERGIDTRRVIVDESCPLYHVGARESYPPMCVIVSDNDMENRLEQTQLLMSTLKHFGIENARLIVMHGTHCQYFREQNEAGENRLGLLAAECIVEMKRVESCAADEVL